MLRIYLQVNPVDIYFFKVNNWNARTKCKIWSKLTIKATERLQWRQHWCRSGFFVLSFEHILHLALVFLMLTLNRKMPSVKSLVTRPCFNNYQRFTRRLWCRIDVLQILKQPRECTQMNKTILYATEVED